MDFNFYYLNGYDNMVSNEKYKYYDFIQNFNKDVIKGTLLYE